MYETYFDRLPVELLHKIFSYLSCHQIIQSFYLISKYLDSVIRNYDVYFLDFSSTELRKREFDLIYSIISPKQIVGLKLGKIGLHQIKHYGNNQRFTSQLRALWLDETIPFNEIYSHKICSIIDYTHLISFRFDRIDQLSFIKQSNSSFKNLRNLTGCSCILFRKLSKDIPQHLTCLHMTFDSLDDLYCLIRPNANQLKSLGIDIKCPLDRIDQFSTLINRYRWKQLIQFKLTLQDMNNVSWTFIQHLLSSMSRLKYLTLIFSKQISTNSDLFNGNQWERFLTASMMNLKKFSLKLPIENQSEYQIKTCLRTFQSSWWLNEKHWFIDYDHEDNALISIPDFSSKIFDNSHLYSFDLIIHRELFYANIIELKLDFNISSNELATFLTSKDENHPCFCHVTRLSMTGQLTKNLRRKLRNNIDIRRIEHVQILSITEDLQEVVQLITEMPNLSSLDIQVTHTLHFFQLIPLSPLISIRHLILYGLEVSTAKRIYPILYRLFPYLIDLKIDYHSRQILCDLLNNLIYLNQITIRINEQHHIPNSDWLTQHTRLTLNSFEFEIFNGHYSEKICVIQINQDKIIDRSSYHQNHKCCLQ